MAVSYGENMFSFVGNCQTVFCLLVPNDFASPLAMSASSCCSTSLPAFGIVSVLDFGHPDWCIVISHCFNFQFLNIL